jgi:predicted nucleotidyltransferase
VNSKPAEAGELAVNSKPDEAGEFSHGAFQPVASQPGIGPHRMAPSNRRFATGDRRAKEVAVGTQSQRADNIFTSEEISDMMKSVTMAAKHVLGEKLNAVILYGSYARGDYREWSDVDVMILADVDDSFSGKYRDEIQEHIWDVIFDSDLLLSLNVTNINTFRRYKSILPFFGNVEREGVVIYA